MKAESYAYNIYMKRLSLLRNDEVSITAINNSGPETYPWGTPTFFVSKDSNGPSSTNISDLQILQSGSTALSNAQENPLSQSIPDYFLSTQLKVFSRSATDFERELKKYLKILASTPTKFMNVKLNFS